MCSPLPGFRDVSVRYCYQGPREERGSSPSLLQDAKLQPMALLLNSPHLKIALRMLKELV